MPRDSGNHPISSTLSDSAVAPRLPTLGTIPGTVSIVISRNAKICYRLLCFLYLIMLTYFHISWLLFISVIWIDHAWSFIILTIPLNYKSFKTFANNYYRLITNNNVIFITNNSCSFHYIVFCSVFSDKHQCKEKWKWV